MNGKERVAEEQVLEPERVVELEEKDTVHEVSEVKTILNYALNEKPKTLFPATIRFRLSDSRCLKHNIQNFRVCLILL